MPEPHERQDAASPRWIALVLAAGEGRRMHSETPKVLHEAGGRPLLHWPLHAAREAGAGQAVVVVAPGAEQVRASVEGTFGDFARFAEQPAPRGTGDAVRCGLLALQEVPPETLLVVLYGDCPLVRPETLSRLVRAAASADGPAALVTGELADPSGYGRILRDAHGRVVAIREHRDCSEAERAIQEVNPGLYAFRAGFLREALEELRPDNAQGELYLTDVVALAAERGGVADLPGEMAELRGVNDRVQLAEAERLLRRRTAERLARSGVTVRDLDAVVIDPDCDVASDVVLERGVHLRGRCRVGRGAHIDVGCVLTDVKVAPGARLLPYTVASASRIGEGAQVGPFSHLRPDSDIGPECRIGNFVETKKTRMDQGAKANHLAYLGDGVIGRGVNVGAGTIFCNYDGFRKHTTVLEDGVFVGSDSQLVAPVRVGAGAYVASGTTVTRDVPPEALAISRVPQKNLEGYATRLKARLSKRHDD